MLPTVDDMRVTVPPASNGDSWHSGAVPGIDEVWPRVERHAGQPFHTITELEFSYRVPGAFADHPRRPRDQPILVADELRPRSRLHAGGSSH